MYKPKSEWPESFEHLVQVWDTAQRKDKLKGQLQEVAAILTKENSRIENIGDLRQRVHNLPCIDADHQILPQKLSDIAQELESKGLLTCSPESARNRI